MRFFISLLISIALLIPLNPLPASASVASSADISLAYKIALTRQGDPYVYGAAGPHRFDCSGLIYWVYNRVGKNPPRTSASQARWAHRITRAQARRGDLVFFYSSGGYVYHAAFYAGHNRVFQASRPGKPVGFERIWTRSIYFKRAH